MLRSSHLLSEVEHLRDRVSIIRELPGPVPEELTSLPGLHDVAAEGGRLTGSVRWVTGGAP